MNSCLLSANTSCPMKSLEMPGHRGADVDKALMHSDASAGDLTSPWHEDVGSLTTLLAVDSRFKRSTLCQRCVWKMRSRMPAGSCRSNSRLKARAVDGKKNAGRVGIDWSTCRSYHRPNYPSRVSALRWRLKDDSFGNFSCTVAALTSADDPGLAT